MYEEVTSRIYRCAALFDSNVAARLTLLNGFSFLVIIIFFHFGSCGRLHVSWLNCQLNCARKLAIKPAYMLI